jgi:hypothetical protein
MDDGGGNNKKEEGGDSRDMDVVKQEPPDEPGASSSSSPARYAVLLTYLYFVTFSSFLSGYLYLFIGPASPSSFHPPPPSFD